MATFYHVSFVRDFVPDGCAEMSAERHFKREEALKGVEFGPIRRDHEYEDWLLDKRGVEPGVRIMAYRADTVGVSQ